MKYERLDSIAHRQRQYRVRDTIAAAILVLGIALAIVFAISQAPGLSPLLEETEISEQSVDETPAQYTARVLADDESARARQGIR